MMTTKHNKAFETTSRIEDLLKRKTLEAIEETRKQVAADTFNMSFESTVDPELQEVIEAAYDDKEQLDEWLKHNEQRGFYVEEYKDFGKEYRLHATQNEVFLSWRKVRKADAEQKWFFNSTNCNWLNEKHENFEKPKAWDLMCEHAILAIRATGLSIGAVDIRCKKDASKIEDFIVCEVNSAPEIGLIGTEVYFNQISKMIRELDT